MSLMMSFFLVGCGGSEETPSLLQPIKTKKTLLTKQLNDLCEKYSTSYTEANGIFENKTADNAANINIVIQTKTYLVSLNESSEKFITSLENIKTSKSKDKENFELAIEQMNKITTISKQLVKAIEPVLEDNEVTFGEYESFESAVGTVTTQIAVHSDTIDTVLQRYDYAQGDCNGWSAIS